jgi:type IV pilus assembly protein PilA
MSEGWFYIDVAGQQVGPATAQALRAAYAEGKLHGSAVVWREGFADWQPIQSVTTQLGLLSGATPPPYQPGQRVVMAGGKPVVVQSSSAGWVVGIIAGGVLLLMVLGIFAAIAIPAYSDYTARARVAQAATEAGGLKIMVAEHFQVHGSCPDASSEGFGEPESFQSGAVQFIELGSDASERCTLRIKINPTNGISSDAYLILTQTDIGRWDVTPEGIEARHLPASMRSR